MLALRLLAMLSRAVEASLVARLEISPSTDVGVHRRASLLPSLNAPTVAPLYNSNWFSVETVVGSSIVRELIPKLLKHGAEGIIEYPLNKVV